MMAYMENLPTGQCTSSLCIFQTLLTHDHALLLFPFNECDSTEDDIPPDGNGCYTNDTHSVLVINTLDPGSYQVQCTLQQNISEEFKKDPSFQENFNNITRSAIIAIGKC